MNKKVKIAFLYQLVIFYKWIPHFIQRDLDILTKYFDVTPVLFQFKHLITVCRQVRRAEVLYIWFAGYHAFFITLLNGIMKKPLCVVTGGYDVANVKEMKYGWMIHPLSKWMVRFVLRHATVIVAVSQFNKQEIERNLGIQKATVAYLAVDTNYFIPSGEKEKIILAVSAVDTWNRVRLKGLDLFVHAARELPDIPFVVIGAQKEALRRLKALAPSNVTFIPPVAQHEILHYYQKAKVFCQLSYYESFGLSVVEAMSCGCTPVVTRQGALPEVVGSVGWYVHYGDIDDIVRGMKKALEQTSGTEAIRQRILEHFSLEQREHHLYEIVQQITKEKY